MAKDDADNGGSVEAQQVPPSHSATPATEASPSPIPTIRSLKRKASTQGGRGQRGQDFWSAVDLWFKEQMESNGNKWSDPAWVEYIQATLDWDLMTFPPVVAASLSMVGTALTLTGDPSMSGSASN
ncbi:hypothetical protein C0991_009698, partial [Blastosporella zonata]